MKGFLSRVEMGRLVFGTHFSDLQKVCMDGTDRRKAKEVAQKRPRVANMCRKAHSAFKSLFGTRRRAGHVARDPRRGVTSAARTGRLRSVNHFCFRWSASAREK